MSLADDLAGYVHRLAYEDLPPTVLTRVRQRLLDSLACVLGAYGSPPVRALQAFAAAAGGGGASVFGLDAGTTPDIAALVNGAMVRYLDYNDGYMAREPGHPSDNIPACLALAQAEGRDAKALTVAIVAAYEIQMRLQDAAALNGRGWDHVNYVLIAMAAAAGRLLDLSERQTAQAINMAVNGHIALRQVRSGELSMWKGVSAANAARNGVFCALLARHGLEGPAPVFEGKMGFMAQVSGPFQLDVPGFGSRANPDFRILRSLTKTWPANGELHTAVWAALALRGKIGSIEEIDSIHVDSTEIGWRILASDPEKWRPRTRETADHSLPYTVARALVDGDISLATYTDEAIADPAVARLMDRVTVSADPALTALFPRHLGNRVTLTLRCGQVLVEEVISGPGSVETPMTDADFEAKFRRMAAPHLAPEAQDAVVAWCADFAARTRFEALFEAMRPATD